MAEIDTIVAILVATMRAGTPLLFAALGELITEKAGVLNLGIEGMMLVGAVAGFIAMVLTGSPLIGVLAAMAAGMAMSGLFGFLTLTLMANQVATGLALTIFGVGLSAFVGLGYIGNPIQGLPGLAIPVLGDIPVLGSLLFNHDPLVYVSLVLLAAVTWFLYRSRAGLILRAVGESHEAAHAIGYSVLKIRYLAVLFGGATSGIAGAYLSLVYTPQWAENMTAGRGWIALALVVFATWRPARVLLGAYLFGGITIMGLHVQAAGFAISSHLVATLPYLATVLVLVLISRDATRIKLNAPAALGKPFHSSG
ncbi:MAG: ABC transporter permease [Rhodospirillales bacterium]|jgi:simple sugar transport system permease protein|nr:ABC transporter permease [Rhodospirillales bacterium]MDP6772897.1 ABC transporter permease [Rhodospirillales bacterium]